MKTMQQDDEELGPDSGWDLDDMEPVEVSPDFRVELCVPFTSEQLKALDQIGHEHGGTAIDAVQLLVERALAANVRH